MPSATFAPTKLTWRDLLDIPDYEIERWIINGELRENPSEFHDLNITVVQC